MALRFLSISALVLATTLFMGCSGGGGGGGGGVSSNAACSDPGSFCLVDCNLGCNFRGCGLTDIAQNQPLIFNFSRDIDPASVGFGSISLKTATGTEPVGNFFVEGATVTFIPDVLNVGGAAFFGFTAGETYFLEIGGAGSSTPLRATSGDALAEPIRCSVDVTLGVVDLDGKPPRVKLLSPVQDSDVPLNTTIVLEFDELIDHGAFFGASGPDAPITYKVRATRLNSTSGLLECDPESPPRFLPGEPQLLDDKVRGVTTVSFTPLQALPGTRCVQVGITSGVRDLAGTPAQPLVLSFTTVVSNQPPLNLDETFADDLMLDVNRSTGSWGGGSAVFGLHGGDGRHGDFDFTDGLALDEDEFIWEWRTDGQEIVLDEQMSNGFFNEPTLTVSDGVFQFTDFVLPEEITLIFKGRNPVRIFVRGRCEIFGKIFANATDRLELWDGKMFDSSGLPSPALPQPGQVGSAGGPGGGGGGQGGRMRSAGAPGTDVKLLPGHVYGGPSGRHRFSGGHGGPVVPAHGDPAQVDFTAPNPPIFPVPQATFSQYIAGGGSGGGFLNPGQEGLAIQDGYKTELFAPISPVTPNPTYFAPSGPDVAPGIAFDFLPKPIASSSDHYVLGGSGGGGGGSHALLAQKDQNGVAEGVLFSSGAGGAGGGGAIAFRAGKSLVMGGASLIECRGGSAGDQTRSPTTFGARAPWPNGIASPGGGGSGGSILFMVDGSADMQGNLDVSPGTGGVARRDLPPSGTTASKFVYHTRGGDGASGYIRLESDMDNPPIGILGSHQPPNSGEVGRITEEWPQVAFQSLWYETNQVFAPVYERYEVEAEVDGATVIYSDDPAVGVLAQHVTTPLAFYIQGADIVAGSGQVLSPDEVEGWRQYVGSSFVPGSTSLNGDSKNGFRWLLILDRSFGADVVIKRVSIVFTPS